MTVLPHPVLSTLADAQANFEQMEEALATQESAAFGFRNLLPHPADDLDGWVAIDATLAEVTSPVFQGAAALALTPTSTTDPRLVGSPEINRVPVVGGRTYTLSIYTRASVTRRDVRVSAITYDSAGAVITESAGSTRPQVVGEWVRVSHTVTVGATASYMALVARPSGAQVGETHYFNAAQIEEGSVVSPYGSSLTSVGVISAGMFTTEADPTKSRIWLDGTGLHGQYAEGVPAFRTLDFDPGSVLGLRLHTDTMEDAFRVDPYSGVSFKLVSGAGDSGRARWLRSDGSVAAEAYGEDAGQAGGLSGGGALKWGQYFTKSWRGGTTGLSLAQTIMGAYDELDADRKAEVFAANPGADNGLLQVVAQAVTAAGSIKSHTLVDFAGQSSFLKLLAVADRKINFGTETINWAGASDSSPETGVAHGLGVTPLLVLVTGAHVSNARISGYRVSGVNSSGFDVVAKTVDGSVPAGSADDDFYWLAIG